MKVPVWNADLASAVVISCCSALSIRRGAFGTVPQITVPSASTTRSDVKSCAVRLRECNFAEQAGSNACTLSYWLTASAISCAPSTMLDRSLATMRACRRAEATSTSSRSPRNSICR